MFQDLLINRIVHVHETIKTQVHGKNDQVNQALLQSKKVQESMAKLLKADESGKQL